MEVSVTSVSDVSREVEITATPDELKPQFEKAYQEQRKKIDMNGFRKGKAPLDLIKKIYGEAIENEALTAIATELYKNAVTEKELKPIGEPILVDMEYKRGEHLRFKIQYDVRPEIHLQNYKGIEIEKPIHNISDADVENELLRLRRINATMEEVQKAVDEEHIVTATLQDLDEQGNPLPDKRSEGVRFYLADEQLEQEFKDALANAETGGVYSIQFEHAHGDQTHTVHEQVTVTKVEKVVLPALDDAFVAKATKDKMKTVEELRPSIKSDLAAYWKSQDDRHVLNSLITELLKRHDFQVPESLTRNVLSGLAEEMAAQYPQRKLPPDFNMEQFENENHDYAVQQAKWALLREELIKAENIDVTDADLEKLAEEEAAKLNIPKERLVNYYKSSEQAKERLVGEKLLKTLTDASTIKEVPATL